VKLLFYRLYYFLREAAQNLRHSPLLAVVSVCTIAVSLILVGFFGYVLLNAYSLLDAVGRELKVTIYLQPDTDRAEAEALANEVLARPDVVDVKILSEDQDRARNIELLPDDLESGLDRESIPGTPCLDLTLSRESRDREALDELATWLASLRQVESASDIHFSADRYRLLYSLIDIFQLVGIIVCVVILFAAIFFIFGTIQLAVYARQEEIEVLKLVGATDRFVKAPFYIEGLFQGLLGSVVALLAVAAVHVKIQRFIAIEQAIDFHPDLLPPGMVLWFLAGGMVLGLLGSAFSVGRHLRV
jgi:cell division transport system permease protein